MKKRTFNLNIIYIIWSLLLIVSIMYTILSAYKETSIMYDKELEASNLSKTCLEEISSYNKNRGMEHNKYDYDNSYILGSSLSNLITTTYGSYESKRTSLNPNFAALFIKMFHECNIKESDEIAIYMSASFPAINISCLAACEILNLKTIVMVSIGSSQMGANDMDFVFPEWVDYLYNNGLLNKRVDYVSFGGEYDTIEGFYDYTTNSSEKENKEILLKIKNRLIDSGLNFIEISDYEDNINERMKIYNSNLKDIKLFVNIGGSIVSLGRGNSSKYEYSGIIENNYLKTSKTYNKENSGLIESFSIKGIKSISILNLKNICNKYDIEYNPDIIPLVTGKENIYYDVQFNKIIPIVTLIMSLVFMIFTLFKNSNKLNNMNSKHK